MLKNYKMFEAKLNDPTLPHVERQIIGAALVMLKQFMTNKTRDLNRK